MKNALTRFAHSRTPLVIVLIILLVILGLMINGFNRLNQPVNRQLEHRHTERVAQIHHDNNQIFGYRAQLSAISDQHMMYLLHHPKLKNHLKYMKLTKHTMKVNDFDDGEINKLQQNANNARRDLKRDHPHTPTHNAFNPTGTKASTRLVESFSTVGLLIIIALAVVTKIAKFKDNLKKRNLMGEDSDSDRD